MRTLRALVLPLLLLALFVPQGLDLDLCACEGEGHALLCGSAPAAAPKKSSCCSEPPPPSACTDEVPEGESCPGCPVVELPDLQLDVPAAPATFDLQLATYEHAPQGPLAGTGFRPALSLIGGRAPPGRVPLYLLLGRIRC